MNIIEQITSAFTNVFSNKMRTFLTMLGIIIGISSVIMITSIGIGIKSMMDSEFDKLGSNLIVIYLKSWMNNVKDKDYLTDEDLELIKNHPNIEYAAPYISTSAEVDLRNQSKLYCSITGTTKEYKNQGNFELKYGRFLNDADNIGGTKAAVISEWMAKAMFGYTNVTGKTFKVDFDDYSDTLTIVGVLKSNEDDMGFVSTYSSGEIFMPIKKVYDYKDEDDKDIIDNIYAGVKDTSKLTQTNKEILRLLEVKHNNSDYYAIESYMDQVKLITKVINGITAFIGFVAAISLLVGGIGVMNIMLVTVTERTREIGIRKSLGATNSNIRTQFLIEAVILSLTGGIIGVIIGYLSSIGIGLIISAAADIQFTPVLSIFIITLVVIISSSIGIIFGVYPAAKAAKLDPIEALRYE
ncbi:MAG: ABC transporter permease [Clostridia bacterium]|nr:ABC transporter permease [Clostridia bacterium]